MLRENKDISTNLVWFSETFAKIRRSDDVKRLSQSLVIISTSPLFHFSLSLERICFPDFLPNTMAAASEHDVSVCVSYVPPGLASSFSHDPAVGFLDIHVTPPNTDKRTPLDICCVVDVSGSMSDRATVQNANGGLDESSDLCILDVVKHALKTIVLSMSDGDRLALVTFESIAKEVLPLTRMDSAGRKRAEEAIESMRADGGTELWKGLHMGMETLRKRHVISKSSPQQKQKPQPQPQPTESQPSESRYATCLLLTDGQPNDAGHMEKLRKYGEIPCSIHTFGFGYNIDSVLLTDIAREGGGGYVFIPDGGFVGTAFVNVAANLLTTFGDHLEADVVLSSPSASIQRNGDTTILGGFTLVSPARIQMGCVHFGQSRSIVVPVVPGNETDSSAVSSVTVRYTQFDGTKHSVVIEDVKRVVDEAREGVLRDLCRVYGVEAIRNALQCALAGDYQSSRKGVKEQIAMIEKCELVATCPSVVDLVADLKGQVDQAVTNAQWFKRWGRHYLPSLAHSHGAEVCTNFKDPGLKHYGGDLFKRLQDQLESVFLTIPSPKPTVQMACYYNPRGGCIAGECHVALANGSTKRVDQIRKGDLVACGAQQQHHADSAEIVCVVKTKVPSGVRRMIHLPCGLVVTDYHPIRFAGEGWVFPARVTEKVVCDTQVSHIYNFVMKSGHAMIVQGVECVTLGHSFTENDVIRHPYFGSDRVRKDLERINGWNDGLIEFEDSPFIRNSATNLVDGIEEKHFAFPSTVSSA
jgi:Mg-chelatase subunit ChlD